MATATRKTPSVAAVDDSAAGAATVGGENISQFIDEASLSAETQKAAERNRLETRPFRQYQKKVILKAGVPNTHQTRQIASHVCGAVARLPFVPDKDEKIEVDGKETTEFEAQVVRTAALAEAALGSDSVWTVGARKLARAALELREEDPDGSKGVAWVNDMREDEAHVLDA